MAHLTVSQRVSAGVNFLNRKFPNWYDRVDPLRLCTADVLTQLYGSYQRGVIKQKISHQGEKDLGFATIAYGENRDKEHCLLAKAWKEEILACQAKPVTPVS